MGLAEYCAVKGLRLTRKTCEKFKHTVCKQILDDALPDGLFEENYRRHQICASLLSGQYELYETRKQRELYKARLHCESYESLNQSGFSEHWTIHGYELVDPNGLEFPGFSKLMREQMTFKGKYQVVLFRKRGSHVDDGSHQYVVAVRGTVNFKDFLTDFRFLGEVMHKSSRVAILHDFVRALVKFVGAQNVVLTGHSLGAALAMIIGQELHRDNIMGLTEFYFNPPYMSLESLVSDVWSSVEFEMFLFNTAIRCLGLTEVQAKACERLKRMTSSVLRYDLNNGPEMEAFLNLRGWCPYLCVNKYDGICNGYLDFFEKVESLNGATTLDNVIAVTAVTYGLQRLGFKGAKPLYFPSANLIITDKSFLTLSFLTPFKSAHEVSHWSSLERSRIEYKQVRGFSGVNCTVRTARGGPSRPR